MKSSKQKKGSMTFFSRHLLPCDMSETTAAAKIIIFLAKPSHSALQ